MSESSNNASGGIGFFGMLTILFIGLKLTGYIDWSWFWVLSPTLIPLIILFSILAGIGVLFGLSKLMTRKRR